MKVVDVFKSSLFGFVLLLAIFAAPAFAIPDGVLKDRVRGENRGGIGVGAEVSAEVRANGGAILPEERQRIRENVEDARERLKETLEVKQNRLKETLEVKQNRLKELVAQKEEKLKERVKKFDQKLIEERKKMIEKAREQFEKVEDRVNELRQKKSSLNESERKEFNEKVALSLEKQVDHRIAAAFKLEVDGAESALVKNFTDFAEAKKTELSSATTVEARKNVIVAVNRAWAEFRKQVAKDLLTQKFEKGLQKSTEFLYRINVVVAKLEEKGFNTTKIKEQSAKISAEINATANANLTVKQAGKKLAYLHVALVHLKNSIQRLANNQAIESLPSPSSEANATLQDSVTVAASTEVAASVTDALAASANLEVSAKASQTSDSSVRPQPTQVASPSPAA